MRILSKSHGYHGICQIKPHQIQEESIQNLMDSHEIGQIKPNQIQWECYQNVMDNIGFVRSNPSNLMGILSKSHGDHGICQISSHQILWVSYQKPMVTMGFVRSVPIKSYEYLIKISWWPWDLSDQFPSNPIRILSKSHGDP